MKHPRRPLVGQMSRLFVAIAAMAIVFLTSSAPAAEIPQPNADKFISALVEAGYPDIAIYYLETINANGSIPAALKDTYDMEMGRLHMSHSGIQPSQALQLEEIELAHQSFAKFIKEKPNHARIRECAREYAMLMIARGTIYRDLADKSKNKSAEQRESWRKTSRESFESARNEFLANQKRALENLKQQRAAKKSENSEEWNDAVTDLLQSWIAAASSYYETAQTYDKASKEYKDFLAKASKEYNEIFEKYGTQEPPYIAGIYARLRDGRIKMDQGIYEDPDKINKGALSIFEETLTLESNAEYLPIREEALQYYMEGAIQYKNDKKPEMKAKLVDRGIQLFNEWYDKEMAPNRRNQLVPLQLQLLGCRLCAEKISTLDDKTKRIGENVRIINQTLEILNYLSKTGLKDDAIVVKAKLGVNVSTAPIPPEKMNFKELLKELEQQREMFATIQTDFTAAAADPAKQQTLQKKMMEAADKFLNLYELAEYRRPVIMDVQQLRQLNAYRYFATYMMYLEKNYYRAIMLADFVVSNYPTDQNSENMADLELTILTNHYRESVKALRASGKSDAQIVEIMTFELKRLRSLAQTIETRTAENGAEKADKAWSAVCDSFVDIGDTKHAEAALGKISANSDQRANCEIRTGNLLWNNYMRGMRADLSVRPSPEKLQEFKEKSQKILQEGVDRMKANMEKGEAPSSNLVFATFTLANLKLNSGDAQGALALLNNPQFGPLVLVKNDSELVEKNQLDMSILRVALRATVSAQQLDDAQAIMDLLEKRVEKQAGEKAAEDENSTKEDELTSIYLKLGMELKENLEVLNREDKKEEADQLEKGFVIFLERIAAQPDAKFGSMLWVAQTYQSLGENASEGKSELSEKAKGFFDKASLMYDKILENIKSKPGYVKSPSAATIINMRSAKCLASARQFEKAIAKMGAILKKTPANIELQADAARCYQMWAETESDKTKAAEYNRKALFGCGKDFLTEGQKDQKLNNKPAIWGWNDLANKMAKQMQKNRGKDERVTNTFFDARLIISGIYLQQAENIKENAKKLEKLQAAEKLLVATHLSYPDLNNDQTFNDYNSRLIKVRSLIKELDNTMKVRGFSELDTAAGFALKEDYQEAIQRIFTELFKPSTQKSVITEQQYNLAKYYAKWAEKLENKDPAKAEQYYLLALNGDPSKVNDRSVPLFIGWNGIIKNLTDKEGKPIKNAQTDNLVPYLDARLAVATITYNLALLSKDAETKRLEQDAAAAAEAENVKAEAAKIEKAKAETEGEDPVVQTPDTPAESVEAPVAEENAPAETVEAPVAEENAPAETESEAKAPAETPAVKAPAAKTPAVKTPAKTPTTSKSKAVKGKSGASAKTTKGSTSKSTKTKKTVAPSASETTSSLTIGENISQEMQDTTAENDTVAENDSADETAEAPEASSAISQPVESAPAQEAQETEPAETALVAPAPSADALPPKTKALLEQAKKILLDDYQQYKGKNGDTVILGNGDILESYEVLLKKIQEELKEPPCGYAPPESLLPKKAEEEEEKPAAEPTNPAVMYGILGGVAFVGLILIIILMWPRKKQKVEKEKLNVTSDGVAVGSEKRDEKVNLGFASEPAAQEKVNLGFAGFGGGEAQEKVDLGFGGPKMDSTFSFDMSAPKKEETGSAPASKPAAKPASRPASGQTPPRPPRPASPASNGNIPQNPPTNKPAKPIIIPPKKQE